MRISRTGSATQKATAPKSAADFRYALGFHARHEHLFIEKVSLDDENSYAVDEAAELLTDALKLAKANGWGLDRWSFYVKDESEKLAADQKSISHSWLAKFAKAPRTAMLKLGRYYKPKLQLAEDHATNRSATRVKHILGRG